MATSVDSQMLLDVPTPRIEDSIRWDRHISQKPQDEDIEFLK
jgi:hypothetical protein